MSLPYKRVLLKLSGEAFKGEREYGIDPKFLLYVANELKEAVDLEVELAIVIGGGNIFRGMSAAENGMDRVTADYTGMLATVMNAVALRDALEKVGVDARVQTAIEMKAIAEPFILNKAIRHLKKQRVVIFAAGTGNPYFTTDTTSALRAAEIDAHAILKATKVDGVYSKDPKSHSDAIKYDSISYLDVLQQELLVMDSTAISLSKDNNIPIVVFDFLEKGNIRKVLLGETVGTTIGGLENARV